MNTASKIAASIRKQYQLRGSGDGYYEFMGMQVRTKAELVPVIKAHLEREAEKPQ